MYYEYLPTFYHKLYLVNVGEINISHMEHLGPTAVVVETFPAFSKVVTSSEKITEPPLKATTEAKA